jgi:hypothetical protein
MRDARYDPMVVQPMRDELTQIGFKGTADARRC